MELDVSIGEAHDTLAWLRWSFEWNWDAAEREYSQAFALTPSYSCTSECRRSTRRGLDGVRQD